MKTLVLVILFIQASYIRMNDVDETMKTLDTCGDSNADGILTKREMTNFFSTPEFELLLKKIGGKEVFVSKHFEEMDRDENGKIEKNEIDLFSKVYVKTHKLCLNGARISEVSKNPHINNESRAFCNCYDLNEDGVIERKELTEFYKSRPALTSGINAQGGLKRFVEGYFTTKDVNGDGTITMKECDNTVKVYLLMIQICHRNM